MSKQDKLLFVSKIQKLIGIIFLIGCLFIPFAPAITLISETISKTYGSAFVFMFGGNIATQSITYKARGVSVLALISFILILISFGLIIASLFLNKKKPTISKWLLFVGSVIILVSSIMFLCAHRSISNVLADALISSHSDTVSQTIFNNTKLEFGIYGISIFGFISSLSLLASLIFDGTFDKVRARIGII